MSELKEIKKISKISLEDFNIEFFKPQKPIIIQNFLQENEISKLNTLDAACKTWKNLSITLSQEYSYNNFESQRDDCHCPNDLNMSFNEYLNFLHENPNTAFLCTEQKTPEKVSELYQFPFANLNSNYDDESQSFFFLGNKNNIANMHFDGDFRPVILYQIFGIKRVYLAPPIEAEKFLPIRNFSTWQFRNMSKAEKENFMSFAKAYTSLLYPGDALYMPCGWWHHFDYNEISASVNFRLKRDNLQKLLGSGKLHINYKSQNIASYFSNDLVDQNSKLKVYEKINSLYNCDQFYGEEKLEKIENLYNEVFNEIYPNLLSYKSTFITIRESELWKRRLNKKSLYPQ